MARIVIPTFSTAPNDGTGIDAWDAFQKINDMTAELYAGISPSSFLGSGVGSPEGVVPAPVGNLYFQTNGTNGRVVWYKRSGTGTAGWRLLQESLQTAGSVFNVKDFGALGEGTDDTTAIQDALTAAGLVGGTVWVPVGTYLVRQLQISSNTTILGAGWGAVLKGTTDSGFDGGLLRNKTIDAAGYAGNSNIRIAHLAIDGSNELNATTKYDAIALAHATGVRIEHCLVFNAWYHAIDICGCQDVSVAHCRLITTNSIATTGLIQIDSAESGSIGSADHAPLLNADGTVCEHIRITGNYLAGGSATSGAGVHFHKRGSRSIVVAHNTIVNTNSGIQDDASASFATGWSHVSIVGNVIRDVKPTGHGIALTNGASSDLTITGNAISGTPLHGIVLGVAGANANNARVGISNNAIATAARCGIRTDKTDTVAIHGNTIGPLTGSGFAAIETLNGTDLAISGNTCTVASSVNDGVSVGASSRATVVGNVVRSARDGVLAGIGSGSHVAIDGNTISNSNQHCIHVEGTSSGARISNVSIRGNTCDANTTGQHVIRVRLARRVTVNGNTVWNINATNDGISMSDVIDQSVSGNIVDGNSGAGTQGIAGSVNGTGTWVANRVANCASGLFTTLGCDKIIMGLNELESCTVPIDTPATNCTLVGNVTGATGLEVTLTDAATILVDATRGDVYKVTLGGNRTLDAPSKATRGKRIEFVIVQNGTGGFTLTWNAIYLGAGTISAGPNTISRQAFVYDATLTKWIATAPMISGM